MKPYAKYILIIFGIILCLAFVAFLSGNQHNRNNFFETVGLVFILFVPITFIIGFILALIKTTKMLGLAMLTVSGISLLVGLGLCSQASFNLH